MTDQPSTRSLEKQDDSDAVLKKQPYDQPRWLALKELNPKALPSEVGRV